MKKLLLLSLVVLTSCSHDCPEPKIDPCDCIKIHDPFTHNQTINGTTTFTTQFVGYPVCDTIGVHMTHSTTNANFIPIEGECFENK